MKKHYLSLIGIALCSVAAQAQIFYSNGATVYAAPGSIVYINGGATIDNTSTFQNEGTVTVTKNSSFPLPGTFTINNLSTVSGDGTYRVEQDWVNNATFTGGNSTVELYGNTQEYITGTQVTTFNNLQLTGTGSGNNRKKTLLGVNANTGPAGVLTINDRELETQINTFFVQNSSTAAVTNNTTFGSEGFVSSTAPGTFSRVTAAAPGTYTFPTGSSVNVTRYRPVDLATLTGSSTYTVRFVNHDADNDGYTRTTNDGAICTAIDTFYHAILRSNGASAADVKLYYVPATDGAWSGMSHWRTTNNMWNDMTANVPGTSGGFTTLTRTNWLFANPGEPYILTDLRPAAPTIVCPSICPNSSTSFVATGGTGTGYTWTIPGNGTITSGQGTDTLGVDWTSGTGYVYVVATTVTGCTSFADSCQPVINPVPNANFLDTSAGSWGNDWTFVDLSTGPAVSWSWDFGDGQSSSQQNPIHTYSGGGTYTVLLTVTNSSGCTDTITSLVNVMEGIVIPNVFSPNGDGINDEFYIANSGLKEYSIDIFDRWGVKIFSSTAPQIHWDGRTTSGQLCTDGTYYYVLKAVSTTQDYSRTGFITLIGSKK